MKSALWFCDKRKHQAHRTYDCLENVFRGGGSLVFIAVAAAAVIVAIVCIIVSGVFVYGRTRAYSAIENGLF